jgi:hypothetical protein
LRVLLAAMVPCFAIGMTGLFVTTIGRLLLAVTAGSERVEIPNSVPVGVLLTVVIMVGCAIAAAISSRMGPQRPRSHH